MIYYKYGRLVKEQSWVPGMGVGIMLRIPMLLGPVR